ncbi:MAG TPA: undecaprenyldiphospho-muramoylpentapeptide beta-N-acetylglucosaminyltransferase [Clostridiaceae bacterium]|jgi:UDP-N-acetylglucosamine--N-acetylmuramyl-(pentapeptide) pyrophosphoryl-undecaprenol N-acetylglucosamine transferase|nr:undecaprenyldiphospho-muramoylpentapeptide beta-N-acetylglucosaminyltransferase [Clostridiaceae bacterium]
MSITALIAGGGTSGHINPAIAIADRIRVEWPDAKIAFCGTERGLESTLVPRNGYTFHPIRASGFPSKPSKQLIRAVGDFCAGRKTCLSLIDQYQPDIVIGTGGYVCGPLVSAAKKKKIPVVLHEQNAFAGRANRTLSKGVSAVCTGFPNMEATFPAANEVVFTGNPIRSAFHDSDRTESRNIVGIDNEYLVLCMGGSLGSQTLNEAMVKLSKLLCSEDSVKLVLSSGKQQHKALSEKYQIEELNMTVMEYIDDTKTYMDAADLIICRAGAVTCAEVAALGVPAVFVPYPHAAGDHQTYNARVFVENHAGYMIADADLSADKILEIIQKLRNEPEQANKLRDASKALYVADAVDRILDVIKKVVNQ